MYRNLLKSQIFPLDMSIYVFLIIAGWACLQNRYAAVADTLQPASCHASCPTYLDSFQWHFLWKGQGKYATGFYVFL